MKRTPLKRGRRKPRPSMAEFRASVLARDGCCVLCGGSLDAILDAHHLVPRQRLDDSASQDPRNGVCLDRFCHHQVEARRLTIPFERLPLGFGDFLRAHPEAGRPVGPDERALRLLEAEAGFEALTKLATTPWPPKEAA